MSKYETEKEHVEQLKEPKSAKPEDLAKEAHSSMDSHTANLNALRQGIKDGSIDPKISSDLSLGFSKRPTFFDSREEVSKESPASAKDILRDLGREDSNYIAESRKELDKIMRETGPQREADLAKWLKEQSANTNPDEAASNLTPEQKKELLQLANQARDVLIGVKTASHDSAGMEEILRDKVNLDRNLDEPPDPDAGKAYIQDCKTLAAVYLIDGSMGMAQDVLDRMIRDSQKAHGWPVDQHGDCDDINKLAKEMYQQLVSHDWHGNQPATMKTSDAGPT